MTDTNTILGALLLVCVTGWYVQAAYTSYWRTLAQAREPRPPRHLHPVHDIPSKGFRPDITSGLARDDSTMQLPATVARQRQPWPDPEPLAAVTSTLKWTDPPPCQPPPAPHHVPATWEVPACAQPA